MTYINWTIIVKSYSNRNGFSKWTCQMAEMVTIINDNTPQRHRINGTADTSSKHDKTETTVVTIEKVQ